MKQILKIQFVVLLLIVTGTFSAYGQSISQSIRNYINEAEQLRLNNDAVKALDLINTALTKAKTDDEKAVIYASQTRVLVYTDSIVAAKIASDNSLHFARTATQNEAKAVAYMSRAYMNNILEIPEKTVEDARHALQFSGDKNNLPQVKSLLYYLLYSAYSNWNDIDKMTEYATQSLQYAIAAKERNLSVNAYNALSSIMDIKSNRDNTSYKDSTWHYLQQSWKICTEYSTDVSKNTLAVTAINIANHIMKYRHNSNAAQQAAPYLDVAEKALKNLPGEEDKISSIYGIRSSFAIKDNNFSLAEAYLFSALRILEKANKKNYYNTYNVYKGLVELYEQQGNFLKALEYQKKAEQILPQIFDEQQIFNTQKLEIQYETEKKDKELLLLKERETSRKTRNNLYAGLGAAVLIGLGFMFRSYHFKLRYSIEREKKAKQEKEEAAYHSAMQLKLEKEEQARLKAEQELLEYRQQQLQKEVMANTLQIEHKNEMLREIKTKIDEGNPKNIRMLLKKEDLLDADFKDTKKKIQQIHPDFFPSLQKKSKQKLTPLDLKYCAYIHLQMTSRQIAQLLNVEVQSVRMFKYRLKQKFALDKDTDLDSFLQEVG